MKEEDITNEKNNSIYKLKKLHDFIINMNESEFLRYMMNNPYFRELISWANSRNFIVEKESIDKYFVPDMEKYLKNKEENDKIKMKEYEILLKGGFK